jgi:hypothetical protein
VNIGRRIPVSQRVHGPSILRTRGAEGARRPDCQRFQELPRSALTP